MQRMRSCPDIDLNIDAHSNTLLASCIYCSLMRHFKRFPEHAPPNLNDGSDTLKPVTVTLEDGERLVFGFSVLHNAFDGQWQLIDRSLCFFKAFVLCRLDPMPWLNCHCRPPRHPIQLLISAIAVGSALAAWILWNHTRLFQLPLLPWSYNRYLL